MTQHQLHMQEKSIDSATAGCSSSAACASSELSQHEQLVLEKSVDSAAAVCSSSAACSSSATSPHEHFSEEHVDLQKGLYASLATGASARQDNLELASEEVVIAASIIEHQGPSIGLKLITIGGESREITILASSTIKDLYRKVALEYKIKPKDVQLAEGKREIPRNGKNVSSKLSEPSRRSSRQKLQLCWHVKFEDEEDYHIERCRKSSVQCSSRWRRP